MTIAVDLGRKATKQTNKQYNIERWYITIGQIKREREGGGGGGGRGGQV